MHRPKLVHVFAAGLVATALGLAVPVAAQTPTATLAIEVRDASDAVMPDVTVMLTNRDSGLGRRGTTTPRAPWCAAAGARTYLSPPRVGFKTG